MGKAQDAKIVVYDIETFINFFSYMDIDRNGNITTFVIHESRNDFQALMDYLLEPLIQVGYNNVNFDSTVLSFMFENRKMLGASDPETLTRKIYNFVQTLINSDEKPRFRKLHPQIDLFLINHFNNKNRSTSLKALQCAMYWPNVQDMPFSPSQKVSAEQIDDILSYNLNDVLSTQRFYELNKENLEIRETFSKLYKKDFTNKSNVAIGEEIFLYYIKEASGLTRAELKEKVIHHKTINLGYCVLPYVKFNSKPMQDLLERIKAKIITKEIKFKHSLTYKGFKFDFGVGGIHGCVPAGVYDTSQDRVIIDFDVKSYYPNLAIQNGFHPMHIDKDVFCTTYKGIFEERVQKQKEGKKLEQEGLKLSLNGIFGKSGEETSAFHDRYLFYKITVNGQLLIAMLCEAFLDFVPGCELLQANTDGLTVRIPKSQEKLCMHISEKFMQKTNLILEYAYYERMIIRDVNNYIAVYRDLDKTKLKGIFATSFEWHQNNSFMAVPKALEAYFVKGIPIEKSLRENNNIYDFCGRYKANRGWSARYNTTKKDGEDIVFEQQNFGKILRFYPTTDRKGTSVKVNNDGRVIELLSGWATKPFNAFVAKPMKDYKIDYLYFETECRKVIEEIEKKQLTLF